MRPDSPFFVFLIAFPLISITAGWNGYNVTHLRRCGGNSACALSAALSENTDLKHCLICHALHTLWSVVPLTNKTASEIYLHDITHNKTCSLPLATIKILALGAGHRANDLSAWNKQTGSMAVFNDCKKFPEKRQIKEELRVSFQIGDTCICNEAPGMKNRLGVSTCKTMVDVLDGSQRICQVRGTTVVGKCPFSQLYSPVNSSHYWICGGKAITSFPDNFRWTGCCYPGVVAPGLLLLEHMNHTLHMKSGGRMRRDVAKYKGYVLASPWIAQEAAAGWEMFPFGGVVAALKKINGLAYMLESLSNDTSDAVLMNEELSAIRTAVIQNRLTIDLLTAKEVGVCKVLNTSCCFSISDHFKNIHDLIEHMKTVIVDPPQAEDWGAELFGWLGSWKALVTMFIPLLSIVLTALCLFPCILQCIQSMVYRSTSVILKHQYMPEPN